VVAFGKLEKEFLPEEDKGRLLCFVVTPLGSTPEYTDRMLAKMEGMLKEIPEIEIYGSIVAPAFSGPGRPDFGILFIRLKEGKRRSVQEIVNGPGGLGGKFFKEIEGAFAVAQIPVAIGRGLSSRFQLVIEGQDLDELNRYVGGFVNQLRGSGYLQGVQTSFEINKPELRLSIDRDRAAALGVSIEDISRTMQILFGGVDLSRIKMGGKEYLVMAQLQRLSRLTPQDLDKLYVRNATGQLIQLSSIVSRQSAAAPNVIEHYNRLRSATISGTLVGIPMGTAMDRVEQMLSTNLPPGLQYDWAGESRDLKEAGGEVFFVLILALIIVYMVLAAQFESLVHPFTVILAVPLAGIGAFGLLWLVHFLGQQGIIRPVPAMNINLFSEIGLVLLVGLVTKNSILLVEFANQQREKGVNARDAMLQAGIVRLRPILMTAFSTIAGIIPIAIGFGAGAESRRPMGIAVVGGMLTSTFLTLLIIPVVYTLLSDMTDWVARRKRKGIPTLESSVE
jgi:multidrug efflux pump